MSTYEIKRDETDHRKVKPWIVLKNGEPMKYSPQNHHYQQFATRKSAQETIDKDIAWDAYLAVVLADDASREYHWDTEEEAQIASLTLSLKLNEERWTFNGKARFVDISRGHQAKDAEDQAKDGWRESHYPAQLRRRMAARVEAFKRADLEL